MTTIEYESQFPDALVEASGSRTRSAETRAKQSAAAKKRWSNESEREAQSERLKESAPWKGKKLSREHRYAISKGLLTSDKKVGRPCVHNAVSDPAVSKLFS